MTSFLEIRLSSSMNRTTTMVARLEQIDGALLSSRRNNELASSAAVPSTALERNSSLRSRNSQSCSCQGGFLATAVDDAFYEEEESQESQAHHDLDGHPVGCDPTFEYRRQSFSRHASDRVWKISKGLDFSFATPDAPPFNARAEPSPSRRRRRVRVDSDDLFHPCRQHNTFTFIIFTHTLLSNATIPRTRQ